MAALSCPQASAALTGFVPEGEGALYPEAADGRSAERPTIQAHRVTSGGIHLDGRLNEAEWQAAQAGRGFRVWDPDRGAIPSEETVFKVAYDEDALYFGIACYEKDPTKVLARLSRRDRFSNSDLVSVYIDPYHDQTTGYNFKVNPLGVQEDSYMYNDGARDVDWDAVWEAETSHDSQGWYTEIRVPFSAIRYRAADSMTWGLQVYRYMHGRGEDTAWTTWDRESRGFISRFGTVSGIAGIRAPRQLEIAPYVVQRTTDPAIQGDGDTIDGFQNVGADVKYGITADLTLNATIQPDFGQVEADPAELNLSPFETFFEEKRPFFVEGNRFFQHPDFNLFYSRRIGTGDPNSRIRYATKVTGKTAGGVSVAALAASTDITGEGQAHNLLKNGQQLSRFFVVRFGKEFSGGRHHVNFMQTVAQKTADRAAFGDFASREAYTSGLDFELNSKNRSVMLRGSFVGSTVNPEPEPDDPLESHKPIYGTGGAFELHYAGKKILTSIGGQLEHDKLMLNDLGYLQSPDEIGTWYWLQYQYNPEGKSKLLNRANINFNLNKSWLYAGRVGRDVTTGEEAWAYGPGHRQFAGGNINGWMQFRGFTEAWYGFVVNTYGTQRYDTRRFQGAEGPLISEPSTYGGWVGYTTDTRKPLTLSSEASYYWDVAKNVSTGINATAGWNQSSALRHEAEFGFNDRRDDTQHLFNALTSDHPEAQGIGGVSYVYGKIHQRTTSLTLRSNILFSRNQSLEIYAQPFLTVGDYTEARELARADSYDLIPFGGPGFDVSEFDFRYVAVNWNAVYRWQYRPGSTFYLVWTQSRTGYDERSFHAGAPGSFRNGLSPGPLFENEPGNTILAKLTYWFAL